MKTNLFTSVLITMLFASVTFGQDVTTVTATNYDISDNLDLTAVASIFGESKDLADFEYRLNNPKTQISNLDLNRDGYVDYLRVIESVEKNTHLIIIQSVLGSDLYQDVATIEVEKDLRSNTLQVQVVGDVFLYGNNYIYEPVYYARPVIFNTFWTGSYVVYHSPWYWGYYPAYYSYWRPYPVFRYRTHVYTYVNVYNTYNYVDVRRSPRAVAMHNSVRSNYYERQNPNQSFIKRNEGYRNSYVMNQSRSNASAGNVNTTRGNTVGTSNNSHRNMSTTGSTTSARGTSVGTSTPARSSSTGISSSTSRNTLTIGSTISARGTTAGTSTPARSSSTGTSSNTSRNASTIGNSTTSARGTTTGTSTPTRSSSMGTSNSTSRSTSTSTIGNSSSNRSSSIGNTSSRSSSSSRTIR